MNVHNACVKIVIFLVTAELYGLSKDKLEWDMCSIYEDVYQHV